MKDIALKHKRKIAESTLRMTPEGARIMGGMTYPEAYKFLFGEDLRTRLEQLLAEYPEDETLFTELYKYGWQGSKALRDLLARI